MKTTIRNVMLAAIFVILLTTAVGKAAIWITLDFPGATYTAAEGIDGKYIVGEYSDGTHHHGFIYDGQDYVTLDYPGAIHTEAWDIDGDNIVGIYNDGSEHGFLYDGKTWTTLDYAGAGLTGAAGIDGGNIVGSYISGGRHGFLYDGKTWTTLDYPEGSRTQLNGIDGNRIVGSYGFYHGIIYDGTTWTPIDYPGSSSTTAIGIDGINIVGAYDDDHGFIYDGETWTTLDFPKSLGTDPYGIDSGRIVGRYMDSSGTYHGFLCTMDDQPSTPCGKLLVGSYNGSDYDLYIMDEDGSDLQAIDATSRNIGHGDVSPDGKTILYSAETTPGSKSIFQVPVDGGSPEVVPGVTNFGHRLCWGDGSDHFYYDELVHYSCGASTWALHVRALDGSYDEVVMTSHSYLGDVSEGLNKIVCSENVPLGCYSGYGAIVTYDADGSNRNVLSATVDNKSDVWPTISPDGEYILYYKSDSGWADPHNIYRIRWDGTEQQGLTNYPGQAAYPIWRDDDTIFYSESPSMYSVDYVLHRYTISTGEDVVIATDLPNCIPLDFILVNCPPIADAGPDQTVECACQTSEGTQVALDGTASYDPDGDPLTYTWTGPFFESPVYEENPIVTLDGCLGEYQIELVVNDGALDSETGTVMVTVVDTTPPDFTVLPQDITVERDGYEKTDELDAWLTTVDAADICGDVTITNDFEGFPYECGNTGSVALIWTATDESDNSATTSATFTIEDPTAAVNYDGDALLSTGGSATVNANLVAMLRDGTGGVPNIDGEKMTFTLTAEGIGTIVGTAESQSGIGAVIQALEPAIYMIEVSLECSDFMASAILVVYNPEGGFATGGGWIIPEDDGLNTHPNERANFGFNAKYKKGDPTGHLEFRYSDGYIDLKSLSIEQLVITGGKIAQFKGWALVNGELGYWFFVKAIDNGEPGTQDTFEIKIWAPGVDIEGDPTERAGGALQGGNIVVHTK